MLYVRMYMHVCLFMKGSLSFDPNNAKFTQNIHEGMAHVKRYIGPKSVQPELAQISMSMCSLAMKFNTISLTLTWDYTISLTLTCEYLQAKVRRVFRD